MHSVEHRLIPSLAIALLLGQWAVSAPVAADARGDKILANLKLLFPQLEAAAVTMGEISASEFGGLDRGSFTINTQQGAQEQQFLVTPDDTQLYFVGSEAIDVSKSPEEIARVQTERAAEEARIAAQRYTDLQAVSGPVRGNPDAPVTIVEFSDFQCPYCSRASETMEQVLAKYAADVKMVFMHYPLDFHEWAMPAAIAAHCAATQSEDAFWALHDEYFENHDSITADNVLAKSKEYLAPTGLDMAAWSECAENKQSLAHKGAASVVDADKALGTKLGVTGTPGFFVNGRFLSGAQPITAFEPLIAEAKQDK